MWRYVWYNKYTWFIMWQKRACVCLCVRACWKRSSVYTLWVRCVCVCVYRSSYDSVCLVCEEWPPLSANPPAVSIVILYLTFTKSRWNELRQSRKTGKRMAQRKTQKSETCRQGVFAFHCGLRWFFQTKKKQM